MSKEDLYNSIRSKKPLSRTEAQNHLSRKKMVDPSELDAFEREALEGWDSIGGQMNTRRLDKKFNKTGKNVYLIAGTLGLIVLFGLLYSIYTNEEPQSKNQLTTQKPKLVEETDLFIAEKFDTLIEKQVENRIEIKSLQRKQEKIVPETNEKEIQIESPTIDKLPILEIETNKKTDQSEFNRKSKIKEIYMSNFKLVDYRVLRSKLKITTKQLDLTGTAANQEHKDSNNDEIVWKIVDIPYIDFIEKSMYSLNQGNIKKALARFEVILSSYPDDINALFYSGFALYSLGEFDQSIVYFKSTLQNEISNFDEEALWYLALCLEKTGELEASMALFKKIESSNSYYSELAKKKNSAK